MFATFVDRPKSSENWLFPEDSRVHEKYCPANSKSFLSGGINYSNDCPHRYLQVDDLVNKDQRCAKYYLKSSSGEYRQSILELTTPFVRFAVHFHRSPRHESAVLSFT